MLVSADKLKQIRHRLSVPWIRECLIFLAFVALTALMTWPWVTSLRNAVSDPGDPYMIAWTLWWDYHQTFQNPLNLFQANIFYPLHYTLAFSEHDYGIAVLFFPLFALGFRPLTVHSLATFLGFAFCGYGTFRLARTLTGSNGVAWIAGIVFAFIPFRFQLMSHLHYLFAGWIPLLIEALVLFARERSWRRASWLGVAFLMNGLTCITWLILTALPLAISAAVLLARHWKRDDGRTWLRALGPLFLALLLLLPFLIPYQKVSRLYGLKWPGREPSADAAGLTEWLSAEPRVKLWQSMGNGPGVNYHLFPGALPLLLAVAGLLVGCKRKDEELESTSAFKPNRRWLFAFDVLSITALIIAVLTIFLRHSHLRFFRGATLDRTFFFLLLFLIARLSISFPSFLRRWGPRNLVEWVRSRNEAFLIAIIWAVSGLISSLGSSFFLNRFLNDLLFPYRSLRIPARATMLCYVGMAILAGMGAIWMAQLARRWTKRAAFVIPLLAVLLLLELHAAPLAFVKGAVDPDVLTMRLKETPMHGGIVDLPSVAPNFPLHLAMLRVADHERPLINAASSFVSPATRKIDELTSAPIISSELMALFEELPASYIVVHRSIIPNEQRAPFAKFFGEQIAAGRLRLVGTYEETNDLYAVTKTEPLAPADTSYLARPLFTQPVLLTDGESERAAAVDALTLLRDPFSKGGNHYLNKDGHVRISIFAGGVNVGSAGSDTTDITAQIEDSSGNAYPATVENVVPLPKPDWLAQIIIRLPDEAMKETKDWRVSIKVKGVTSNKVVIKVTAS